MHHLTIKLVFFSSSAKVSAKVEVYLNTAFIESKDVTTLPTIEKTAEIYFGTDLDSNGAETGMFKKNSIIMFFAYLLCLYSLLRSISP